MKLPNIDTVAMYLLILGGLNAGVNAVFDYNAIGTIAGSGSVNTVIYALMGLSAVYMLAGRWGVIGGGDS